MKFATAMLLALVGNAIELTTEAAKDICILKDVNE